MIKIDIPARSLALAIDDAELENRRKEWRPRKPKITKGYLARYARQVTSGATGAILKD